MHSAKKSLVINFSILILIALITLFFIELQLEKSHESEVSQQREKELNRILPYLQNSLGDRLKLTITSLLDQPGVIEAFAGKDRKALETLSRNFLQKYADEGMDIFAFIGADNRHFLRLHAPGRFGDNLSDQRPVIPRINRDKREHSGFEATLYGEYFLAFVPVFSKERYIGFVQTGIAIEKVRQRLETILDVPTVILVRTDATEKELNAQARKVFGTYTVAAGPDFVKTIGSDLSRVENGALIRLDDGREYTLHRQKIVSDMGKNWGEILLFYDISPHGKIRLQRIISHLLIVLVAMIIMGLVLRHYFMSTTNMITRREKLVTGISKSMGEGVYVLNDKGLLVFLNGAAEKMLGYRFEEIEGENIHELIHHHNPGGERVPTDLCPILEVIRTGETYRTNNDIFFKKDGTQLPVRHTTTPLLEKGEMIGSVTVFQDISVFKENEAKLRELNLVLEGEIAQKTEALRVLNYAQKVAHIGHWEMDIVRGSVEWSNEVYRIMGVNPQEFVPSRDGFLAHVHPDDREWLSATYRESLRGEKDFEIVHRIIRPDGEVRYVEERCIHEYGPGGEAVRSLGTVHDITERYLAEELLRELNSTLEARVAEQTEELQTSNRILEKHVLDLEMMNAELAEAKEKALQAAQARSNFISSVSHELRTPLNAIINFTDQVIEDFEEMIADRELQKESKGFLQRVLVNSRHLLQLINELLEFTKAEAGKMDYKISVQDINTVVRTAYNSTHSLLSGSLVDFRMVLHDEPLMAAIDSRRLLQVLMNLLSNAAKFTQEGFIEIRSLSEGEEAVIEIEDTGRGIPTDKQQVIFDPFAQVKGSDPGTGLGLGLAKRMCDDMQVTIGITSVEGRGTIFRLGMKRKG